MSTMLVNAFHSTLENRKESFDGVGMNIGIGAGNVFAEHVLSKTMSGKELVERFVLSRIISHYMRVLRYVGLQDRKQGSQFQVVHNHAARFAGFTVNQGKYFVLMFKAAPNLRTFGFLGEVSPDKGFINFNRAAFATEWRHIAGTHCFANAMRHEPCALESDAKGAMQLIRANAFLAGRDQEDRLQPKAQRDMAGFKYSADFHSEGLAAVIALVSTYASAFALHLADAFYTAAMRAYRTFRPDAGFNESVGGFFVVKVWLRKYAHDCFSLRWKTIYAQIVGMSSITSPKIGYPIEIGLLKKLSALDVVDIFVHENPQSSTIYYRNAGGRYWRLVKSFPSYFKSSSGASSSTTEHEIHVLSKYLAVAATLYSSSLFYWFWRVASNCRHLTKREFENFRVPKVLLVDPCLSTLERLRDEYEASLKINAVRKIVTSRASGVIKQDEYRVAQSKSIIDQIDQVIANALDITDEELDYIINYDIKYRMGLNGAEVDGDD
jgi:hypothetical protein